MGHFTAIQHKSKGTEQAISVSRDRFDFVIPCRQRSYCLLKGILWMNWENQDSFRPYIDCDFERYLSHMRCTRVWGTAVEILATASLLQNSVFTLIPSVNTYKWFRYNPLRGDRLTFPSQDPPPKQLSRLNHIELLNVRGCHYDCISSQDGVIH